MKVAEYMPRSVGRKPKSIRYRVTYRAARRNIAKFNYRRAKRKDLHNGQ